MADKPTETIDSIEPKILTPSGLDWDKLDQDALRAVQRLQDRGFEAYLVGGCVRDLLAGSEPKDFDIATSASPQQVRRCFPRNCRIIGRRFKLAHLHFDNNQKILEVSTFRKQPEVDAEDQEDGDLLITQDNEFGTAQEDALRRDFTVNALFLDSVKDRILDYAEGLADIQAKIIRCIGDPLVRFREDPVRILRAAKFCGRLGLHAEPATLEAMIAVAPDLTRAAPPRLLEEILRLLRGGHALDSFQILRDIGAIEVILPVVGRYLHEAPIEERIIFWRLLEALDMSQCRLPRGTRNRTANGLLLGTLYTRPVLREATQANHRSPTSIAEEMIQPFAEELRLPKRDTGCVKRICGVQARFTSQGKQRFKTSSFLQDPYFEEALSLFAMTCAATGEGHEALEHWQSLSAEHVPATIADATETDDAQRSESNGRNRSSSESTQRKKSPRKRNKPSTSEDTGRAARGSKKTSTASRSAKNKKKSRRSSSSRQAKIETIEPEAIDLSAFDVELDPKRVPTFGTIVEGPSKKKRRAKLPSPETDDYKPPPPPGSEGGDAPPPPPPAPSGDDVFGDW